MRTYDLALVPGVDTRLNIDYKFLLVLADGGFPFDVSLFKGSGFQKCESVAAGFGLRLAGDNRGRELFFTSANAQTIKVFVGDDEAIYQRLSGNVTVNGGSLSSVTTLTGITNTVDVADKGYSYAAAFKANTVLSANTPETVIAPAANINGIIIWDANVLATHGSNLVVPSLLAKTSAPANVIDGDVILSPDAGTGSCNYGSLKRPVRVAAGKGLYFIDTLTEAQGLRQLKYTLL
jgi:hypothetical protein